MPTWTRRTAGVAALGNIFTHRDDRRHGYATLLTSAVTAELLRMGLTTIVLNVRGDNHRALRIYERLGFQRHCDYCALIASRRLRDDALLMSRRSRNGAAMAWNRWRSPAGSCGTAEI